MKKIYNFAFFLALLIAPAALWSQCGLFYDSFESQSLGTSYNIGTGTYTRTFPGTGAAQGTYYFQQAGSSTFYQGTGLYFPSSTPSDISFYVRTSNLSAHNAYFVIGDASISSNNGTIFIYVQSGVGLRFYSSPSLDYIYSISANTWYHVELKNINFSTFTYDIWVNGSLQYTGMSFRNNTANINQVQMFNLSNATAGYDEIIIGGTPLTISTTGTDPYCYGDSNGTAMGTVSGSTAPLSYAWSTGDTTDSIGGLPSGTVYLTVSDTSGCTVMDSITLTDPSPITSSIVGTPVTCPGGSDGSADLTASGGSSQLSYSWTGGATTEDISSLTSGTWMVSISDSNGCNHQDSVQITEPQSWSLTWAIQEPACNGDANGSISLGVSGATAPYSYSWNTGDTTNSISNLTAGNYQVTVTDSQGCATSDSTLLSEPAILSLSGVATADTGGNSTGALDLTVSGGTAPYTFSWSNSATTEDLSGLSSGTYSVTVMDANGCQIQDTFLVDFFLGLAGEANLLKFSLWPNPTQGTIQISLPTQQFENNAEIRLLDLKGRVLMKRNLANQVTTLDLNEYAAGMYLVEIQNGTQSGRTRLVKK
ncbi:MAG: T9SS type A sorting domain-containing protein [Bacteroidia bacterium]|nr:T9SS type A sorting domain-containing protein [Bacteroidia bacterium]